MSQPVSRRERIADFLSLERNVSAAAGAVLLLGLGEELWRKFLPKYLEALGASALVIGAFGTAKDFLDGIYQYPGGWLADHLGRRRAFFIFIAMASLGYLVYALSPSWPFVFAGLALTMAWESMASPAIFAVIGDALPRERRAMGFTLQAILRRVPRTIAPLLGGALIGAAGTLAGVRAGLAITLALAGATVLVVRRIEVAVVTGARSSIHGVWRSFHGALKKLLVSDIIIRMCEGLAEVFIVLYVTNILGVSIVQYGVLVAIQQATSMAVYLPSARIAGRIGRKPFVVATFVCFALYPIAVALSSGFPSLVLAFVVGGLREIGEPSRKAMIVDSAEPHLRARTVGLYYLVRSLTIAPASAIGGLLWSVAPRAPFLAAGAVGLLGVIVFTATVEERHAA